MNLNHKDEDTQLFEKSWLVSYGDLFTLLFMIITVVASLYYLQLKTNVETINDLAEQKVTMEAELLNLESQKDSMLAQLHTLDREMEDLKQRAIILDDSLLETKEQLEKLFSTNGLVTLEESAEGLVLRIRESLLFPSGSATLNDDGQALIADLAEIIGTLENKIRIEGHTDNIPSNTQEFPSNWELSTARSISVMKEFVNHYHFIPERFIISGWGEFNPLVENTTAENRALNRRVEIILLNSQLSQ